MSDEAAGAGNTLCISNGAILAGKIVLFLWNSSIKCASDDGREMFVCSMKGEQLLSLFPLKTIIVDSAGYHSASSQLCQTFCTSSLSSNISSIF